MIFQDRTGTNLNRKKITIISQTPNEIIADIERADNPTIEGTPINASVFNAFQQSIDNASNNATNALGIANSANTNATNAVNRIDTLESEFDAFKSSTNYLNSVYPIGAIYISANSTSPSSLFGGEWEQIKDRFLLSSGDTYTNGATGGESTHTLTIGEMPTHDHIERWQSEDGNINDLIGTGNNGDWGAPIPQKSSWEQGNTIFTYSTGDSQPHNNMPPYLVVYMWKRIA